MTARDDYPNLAASTRSFDKEIPAALDEIDRLRALHDAVWNPEWEDVDGTVHDVIAHLRSMVP